ncbi:MAG: DUF2490 domain-containing protein, partial [Raineya sp.]|nr:DUF2490 domain-containing protein [Raineya sp.]
GYAFNSTWSANVEAQLRSLGFYGRFHYYEVKGGITYRLNKQFAFAVFGGTYQTYANLGGNFDRPKINDEERLWFQANLHNEWGRIFVEHRYRYEARWTLRGFRNRFRYRLQLQIPLNKPIFEPKTLFSTISNELFLTDRATYFERNRFFVGLGYQWNSNLTQQIGWLYQFDYFINDEIGKNFLQITLALRFKKAKKIMKLPENINNESQ